MQAPSLATLHHLFTPKHPQEIYTYICASSDTQNTIGYHKPVVFCVSEPAPAAYLNYLCASGCGGVCLWICVRISLHDIYLLHYTT